MLPCLTVVGAGFNEFWLTTYLLSGSEAEETIVGVAGAGHIHLVMWSLTGADIALVQLVLIVYCGLESLGAF